MNKFRKILVSLLVAFSVFSAINITSLKSDAAVSTVNLSYNGIKAGTTVLWHPSGNQMGYSMTGGDSQKLKFCLNSEGNMITVGLYKNNTGEYISFYSSTLRDYNTSELSKTITYTTYYKPYFKNRNLSVLINVYNTSYLKYQ